MRFSDLTIGRRIAVSFGVFLALLIVVAATSVFSLRTLQSEVDSLTDDRIPKIEKAGQWQVSLLQSARHSRNTLILEEHDKVIAEVNAMREERGVRGEILKWMKDNVHSESAKRALEALQEARNKYSESEEKFVRLIEGGDMAAAKKLLLEETRPLQLEYLKGIDAFMATQIKLVAEESELAKSRATTGLTLLLTFSGLALGLACLTGYLLTRSITRQLGGEPTYAAHIATEIAAGNLAIEVDTHQAQNGSLLMAMKHMRDSLAGIVRQVRQNSEGIAVASNQIAQGNQDLSGRTEQQASALEETAASMEELGSTVRQNAENARQANQMAQNSSTVAIRGGEVVSQVVDTMKDINESSKRIVDIITAIDGIAFQTNILALNAAVEAARAGEQGRGFAVVAGEVRTLAQRSAEAAKEIKTLITTSVERVGQGTVLVDQAGVTMDEVVGSIKRVTDLVSEISAANDEQNSGVAQVAEAVTQMDHATQQNAALVEESAAAATSLKTMAEQLVQAVSIFKLSQAEAARATATTPVPQWVKSASPQREVRHEAPQRATPQQATPHLATPERPKPAARSEPKARSAPRATPPKPAQLATVGAGADEWSEF